MINPQTGEFEATRSRPDPLTATAANQSASTAATEIRLKRIQARDSFHRRLLAIADVLAACIAFVLSAVVFGDDRLGPFSPLVPLALIAIVKLMGLYDRDEHILHRSTIEEIPKLFAIATAISLVLWLSDSLIVDGVLGRRQILGTWFMLAGLLVAFRWLARRQARLWTEPERCLLVGSAARGDELRAALAITRNEAELTETIEQPLDSEIVSRRIAELDIDRVILVPDDLAEDSLLFAIRDLKASGVKVSVLPDASRIAGSSVELDHVAGMTMLGMRRFDFSRSSRLIKRSFDLAVASILLALASPLLIGVALAIKLDSPGPILFRQSRVGRSGRSFLVLKFRSMVVEADALKPEVEHLSATAGSGLFKVRNDPRVTRIGRMIRSWSIDELPQLVNVLRGEMSLVGPRPLVPEEDSLVVGTYRRRLDVPPGMTGHWQVLGGARVPLDEMVKLDYLYVANWSLWRDIILLMRTIPVVIGRHGL